VRLGARWHQSVIVDSRPGATGNIGAALVVRAPADGYALLFTIPEALAITKASGQSVGFDPAADLEPVALVALSSTVLIANANAPFKTFGEFLDYARKNPGKLNWASQGRGSSFHLGLEQFKTMAGVDIVHVPYKGAAPALTDLLAGRVDVMIATTTFATPYVTDGKVRVIAVTSAERLKQFSGVPTVAEMGYPGFDYAVGLGIFVRRGTPSALINRINADIRSVMHEPSFLELLGQSATVTTDLSANDFRDRWQAQERDLAKLISTSHITFE
jgi:tripartite-type tricarboxylate transporter receptor subunit TctC